MNTGFANDLYTTWFRTFGLSPYLVPEYISSVPGSLLPQGDILNPYACMGPLSNAQVRAPLIPFVMGTPTRKLGRFVMPAKGVSDPNMFVFMVAKDVTKFEGMVGTGIIVVCAGMLRVTSDS